MPVTEAIASRHVVAVMIDDLYAARPQSGLSQASVVWQAPAEGGIPRYMALFSEGNPPAVGPVRSSRLYFIAWASEWKSVYVHAGGSPQALALLNSSKGKGSVVYNADEFRHGGTATCGGSRRASPHTTCTRMASTSASWPRRSVPRPMPTPSRSGTSRPTRRSRPGRWAARSRSPISPTGSPTTTDRKTNTYLRNVSVEGKQYDAGTKPKTRIAPKNVIVMVVRFVPLGDKKHRLDGQVTGSGTAWISTNGKTVKGTWKKKSFTAPTRFYGPDGKPVTLTMGQTFVQVVPRGTTITIKDGTVPATT